MAESPSTNSSTSASSTNVVWPPPLMDLSSAVNQQGSPSSIIVPSAPSTLPLRRHSLGGGLTFARNLRRYSQPETTAMRTTPRQDSVESNNSSSNSSSNGNSTYTATTLPSLPDVHLRQRRLSLDPQELLNKFLAMNENDNSNYTVTNTSTKSSIIPATANAIFRRKSVQVASFGNSNSGNNYGGNNKLNAQSQPLNDVMEKEKARLKEQDLLYFPAYLVPDLLQKINSGNDVYLPGTAFVGLNDLNDIAAANAKKNADGTNRRVSVADSFIAESREAANRRDSFVESTDGNNNGGGSGTSSNRNNESDNRQTNTTVTQAPSQTTLAANQPKSSSSNNLIQKMLSCLPGCYYTDVQSQVLSGKMDVDQYHSTLVWRSRHFHFLRTIRKTDYHRLLIAKNKNTKLAYCVKVSLKSRLQEHPRELRLVLNERRIATALKDFVLTQSDKSHFITRFFGNTHNWKSTLMIFEYHAGGSLHSLLRRQTRLSEQTVRIYVAELVLGLEYLHRHDIVHRNLRPECVFIDSRGHLKICDFEFAGFATIQLNLDTDTKLLYVQYARYLAPEVIELCEPGQGQPGSTDNGTEMIVIKENFKSTYEIETGQSIFDKNLDLWCLGCLAFEMMAGYPPFGRFISLSEYKMAIGKETAFPPWFTGFCRNFILKLAERDIRKRLAVMQGNTLTPLKQHLWFRGVDWVGVQQLKEQGVSRFVPKLANENDFTYFDDTIVPATNEELSQTTEGGNGGFVGRMMGAKDVNNEGRFAEFN